MANNVFKMGGGGARGGWRGLGQLLFQVTELKQAKPRKLGFGLTFD